jgi:hypothetical protein
MMKRISMITILIIMGVKVGGAEVPLLRHL